jgi:hypothetical protein
LKKYKSPGSDQIPAELIQAGGEILLSEIHKLINSVWNKEILNPYIINLSHILIFQNKCLPSFYTIYYTTYAQQNVKQLDCVVYPTIKYYIHVTLY